MSGKIITTDYTDKTDFKSGFAPRGALLAALWGDEPFAGKLRLHLFSEAVRTFTGVLLEVS
jgi:hypothetical protein